MCIRDSLCLLWIGINALAFATHYFVALALLAQGLVFLALALHQGRTQPQALWRPHWRRLYGVALGTAASCLAWLPVLTGFYGSTQSSGLAINLSQPMRWLDPVAQMLAGLIFMVITPITHGRGAVGIAAIVLSVLVLLPVLLGLGLRLWRAKGLVAQSDSGRYGLVLMGGFVLAAIVLFFGVTYGLAMDITRGHRYNFAFHPGVMVLLGGLLAVYWPETEGKGPRSAKIPWIKRPISGRRTVQIIWVAGLVSTLFVVSNLAFAKYYDPARFIRFIQAESTHPVVLGFPTTVEEKPTVIGHELLSVAWEIQRHFNPNSSEGGWSTPPQFFIWTVPTNPVTPPEEKLAAILAGPPRPFDLWLLNADLDLSGQGCTKLDRTIRGGHTHIHYECLPT
ncbi:hypothetical protein C7271_25730 [filamentous cyanobacterium CCP5]|nr:hypothetical protein C7271_25730 [filamentous cyanobacterium CCP5]